MGRIRNHGSRHLPWTRRFPPARGGHGFPRFQTRGEFRQHPCPAPQSAKQ